jgi:hypothetical protein
LNEQELILTVEKPMNIFLVLSLAVFLTKVTPVKITLEYIRLMVFLLALLFSKLQELIVMLFVLDDPRTSIVEVSLAKLLEKVQSTAAKYDSVETYITPPDRYPILLSNNIYWADMYDLVSIAMQPPLCA